MKLYTLTRRFTAAVLTAAMALSFCAPALAEAPGTAADPAAPAATASTAENSTADTIVFDQLYLGTQKDWAKTITGAPSGDVVLQYTAANRTLTVTGTYSQALTISAPGVNVVLNGTTGPAVKGDLNITASASVIITSSAAGAQAVTGSTDITSDGAVSITGTDRAVGGENLTVNAGGDVTITGGTTSQPTVNDATVRCGGEFELRNLQAVWCCVIRPATASPATCTTITPVPPSSYSAHLPWVPPAMCSSRATAPCSARLAIPAGSQQNTSKTISSP